MESKQYKRPVSVLVVVYSNTGDVLLMRRKDPSEFWQSVTGSLEWGEQPREAAVRELHEETGLVAGDRLVDTGIINSYAIYPEWRDRYEPGVSENTEYVFLLCLPDRCPVELNPDEHGEYCWLPACRAIARASSVTNRAAIESLFSRRTADGANTDPV